MSATAAIATTYDDVEKLLYSTVHQFIRKHGGEFAELMSTARFAFVRAYHDWNPARSAFSTTVRWYVWQILLEELRGKIKRQTRIEYREIKQDEVAFRESRLIDLLDELPADARMVVSLIIDTPCKLEMAMEGDKQPAQSHLKRYLRGLGWTAVRITESFSEIRKALQT